MSDESQDRLDRIYADLKKSREEIQLKVHLGGMELREKWNGLDAEWKTWTHQLGQELGAMGDDLESKLREAGGDDLRKLEIKTRVASSKLTRAFQEIRSKLTEG